MNETNNGLGQIFDDLLTGRKTVEQVKQELEGGELYLRAGKNYRKLTFNGFAAIGDTSVKVYVAEEKIDNSGQKVAPKPRSQKAASKKRGS